MICESCSRENPSDASFCAGCGQKLSADCRGCGRTNTPDSAFCNGCGRPLDEGAATLPVEEAPAPRDYTPRHLADKILTTKSAIEGERKQVTVLFADLQRSMELAESIDPEEWHEIMDRFFAILADGIHRFEGTVNQYTGDGIMALFGAPLAHEDHAQRACWAALGLQESLREYGQQLKRERGLTFSVRTGIHSGEVVVGKIGDDLRMDYTAQGHTVGLAARMQQLASPDTVYLTESVASLVEGYFELKQLGSFQVKGVSEAVEAYELIGIGAMRTRLDVSQARGFSKFVGRSEEMALLERARQNAESGQGQVIGLVADAGTGKSRLCFEFLEHCRARGFTTYEARGVAHGKGIPFIPILELFRNFFGVNERDPDEGAREKIAGRLLLLSEDFRETLPMVFDFLGVPDTENPAPKMDPDAWRRQWYALVKRVVHARSEKERSITLVEDLHWIDDASEGFIRALVESTPLSRNLTILNFRPEYSADWMRHSFYQQLPLVPLGPEAIRELLVDLLGDDQSLSGLPEQIHDHTAGNPFFIEEVAQTLVENGSLEGTRGAYRLATPIEQLSVPPTVQSVLAARIDRLAEREKHVLQTGSVIGKDFGRSLLDAVADLPDSELDEAQRRLIESEFVYELALYPETVYAFKHPLTQEVAYGSQLGSRRSGLHARLARTLEAVHVDKQDENAALIAHHWAAAGEALRAAQWTARAARHVGTSDAEECFRLWREVRRLSADAGDSEAGRVIALDAIGQIMNFGFRMKLDDDEVESLFAEGEALAEQIESAPPEHAMLLFGYSMLQSDGARMLEFGTRGRQVAIEAGDWVLGDECLTAFYGHLLVGNGQRALDLNAEVRGRQPEPGVERKFTGGTDPYLWALHTRCEYNVYMGRLEEAERSLEEALPVIMASDARELQIWALGMRSHIDYHSGDPRGGVALGRRALEIAERVGAPVNRVFAMMNLSMGHIALGEIDEARPLLEGAIETVASEAPGGRPWGSVHHGLLAEVLARLGEAERAIDVAREGIAIAQRQHARGYAPFPWHGLSLAYLALGREPEAEEAIDGLAACFEGVDTRALAPREPELRAELAQLRGDDDARVQHLRAALDGYRAMNANGHAKRIEAALREGPN